LIKNMKKENKRKYTTIIKELDLIISKINSPDIPIDKSIKLYEEGVKLSDQADKELSFIENNIDKYKNAKKSQIKKIDIENSFKEIEILIENLEDENLKIDDAEIKYKKALDIIYDIESYLKKAKSTIEKYEQ
tara:strand:+ start:1037 stop:1435 length:399 start_codon:yes stop_codon:yes gene_type:complete